MPKAKFANLKQHFDGAHAAQKGAVYRKKKLVARDRIELSTP